MVYFVGAGTGAVDLITVRGMRLLENADVIIYAGSLVNPELLKYANQRADIHNSAALILEEVINIIKKAEEEGKNTVRLHTGDPSIYGAVREQMDRLDTLSIPYESCPGVSACFGAAASLNLEYTLPGVSQSLVITRMEGKTSVPEKESIQSFAAHQTSMAIYLSSGMLGELSRRLQEGGYPDDTPAAIVYKATWPEEKRQICTIATLEETADRCGIYKTAIVLVGNAIAPKAYQASRLYAPDFETEFRKRKYSEEQKNLTVKSRSEISVISFTNRGREWSKQIKVVMSQEFNITLYCKSEKYKEAEDIHVCKESLSIWTWQQFKKGTAILFIGASGIAVRAIAACIKDKLKDVPVLVMDEAGQFVIPILSGHFGGANELAEKISKKTGATPVITTATDINHKFAVDVFARKNHLYICNRDGIKQISSAILAKEKVTIAIDGSFQGKIPEELTYVDAGGGLVENTEVSILVSPYIGKQYKAILQLCPKAIVLGIGCKRGKSLEEIEQVVCKQIEKLKIPMEAVAGIGTIDIKKDEKGLCEFVEKYKLICRVFSEEELNEVEGTYTASDFVKNQTGVDNVCERAAVAASGEGGSLILRKQAENGITVAAAIRKWSVDFT